MTIQQRALTGDGQGGNAVVWTDVTTCWASVEPFKAWEQYIHQQVQHTVTHQVVVRYQSGITPDMRILFGSRVFRIVGESRPNERRIMLVFDCLEIPVKVAP